ncbi:hypothetical protein X739_19210 [Mesorhizobium sp. LNHC220B00]|jgi:hypothetical protein|nr:hypothetical protein X739_19210 [Mesorhizobium sp. LNHC220B00]ESY92616.1 hypothetical protein X741_19645 [Mesorhizobium sp. LNHC229A00]ESY94874.1 hypothetical protein X738_23700 [Mesorhizobium sp. LNHC209A00]
MRPNALDLRDAAQIGIAPPQIKRLGISGAQDTSSTKTL